MMMMMMMMTCSFFYCLILPDDTTYSFNEHTYVYDVTGQLEKQSHDFLKRWQSRWIVLDGSTKTLTYYEGREKITLKGDLAIESVEGDASARDLCYWIK